MNALAWMLVLLGAAAPAQPGDTAAPPALPALPALPERASDKQLSAMITVADEAAYRAFEQQWYSLPSEQAPHLHTTAVAHRGQPLRVAITYAGCAGDARTPPRCTATLDLHVIAPDGRDDMPGKALSLGGDQPVAPRLVQLSPATLGITFEAGDKAGLYEVRARIHDPLQNATVVVGEQIQLSDRPLHRRRRHDDRR